MTALSIPPLHATSPQQAGPTRAFVVARAPARLDFGGGWTDVPPYCDEVGGCVCNVAITRYATVRLGTSTDARTAAGEVPNAAPNVMPNAAPNGANGRHERMPRLAVAALHRARLRDVRADVWSDFPVSAGLGGSSAAGVALAAAIATWRGESLAAHGALDDARRTALAEQSRAVEVEDAGIAGGRQDHYAAAYGGALRLDFTADGAPVGVTRLALSDDTRVALARRCVVVYTGESRISGETITAVLRAYGAGEPRVVAALARMRTLGRAMSDALAAGRLDELGALVGEHWAHQRALHQSIPTAHIDEVIARATAAGALGAKALGASGGGCVLAIARDGAEDAVRAAVAPLGTLVEFEIDVRGVTVEPDDARPRLRG